VAKDTIFSAGKKLEFSGSHHPDHADPDGMTA